MTVFLATLLNGCSGKNERVQAYGKPVQHWLGELQKPEPRARKKAVIALGQIASADPETIPALIGAVKDQDPGVRTAAILALLQIGPAAKEAIPAISAAQNDRDPTIRAHAKKALERIKSGQ